MPISQHDVVDAIGINPSDGAVELYMYEERPWRTEDIGVMLSDLQSKVNRYIEYVFGGQMDATVEYYKRSRRFIVHVQYEPPEVACNVYRQLLDHLKSIEIDFRAYLGPDRSYPIKMVPGHGREPDKGLGSILE